MRVVALVNADFSHDFFGAPSTLGDDLAGAPVLRRTLDRLARVPGLDGVAVVTDAEHADRVHDLARPMPVTVFSRKGAVAGADLMRIARSFARYCWRGGLAGTTVYDELFDPGTVGAVIERTSADAVFLAPGGAALLDVNWAGEMVASFRRHADKFGVTFCQAPPGLAGVLFSSVSLQSLVRTHQYPGRVFSYSPGRPVRDPIHEPYNHTIPDWTIATYRRLIADSRRGLWLCRQIVDRAGPDVDGLTACRIARELGPEPWPREVTVELTTRRPVQDDLRPAADRADLPIAALERALGGLEESADLNVMFAGAGDSLLHADWPAAVRAARRVGCVGMATYGTTLDDATIARLLESGPDILQVYVDAMSDGVYAAHKRGDSASAKTVWEGIERLVGRAKEAHSVRPMVVPTMLKTRATLDEQDEFFEKCLGLTGWGLIIEPTAAAGQWDDHAVVHMAPPSRFPCRRIDNRLTLLSDGSVAACEEDFRGRCALGQGTLLAVWRGAALSELRQLHSQHRWQEHPLCAACQEFHRP
jgi:hypothetical protein